MYLIQKQQRNNRLAAQRNEVTAEREEGPFEGAPFEGAFQGHVTKQGNSQYDVMKLTEFHREEFCEGPRQFSSFAKVNQDSMALVQYQVMPRIQT